MDNKVDLVQGLVQDGMSVFKEEVTGVKKGVTTVDTKMDQMLKNQAYLEEKNLRLEQEIVEHKLKRDRTEHKLSLQTDKKNKAEAAVQEMKKTMMEREKEVGYFLKNQEAMMKFQVDLITQAKNNELHYMLRAKDREMDAKIEEIIYKDNLISVYKTLEEERARKRARAD